MCPDCQLRGIDIHPMHYLFVASGFFVFHLLFTYGSILTLAAFIYATARLDWTTVFRQPQHA